MPPQASKDQRRVALFTGSFDPLTLGHVDLIRRASPLFHRLVVAIGEAQGKSPVFSAAERLAQITAACASLPNVEVERFTGLAVDFARLKGASVLLRGLRSQGDFDYEMQMAQMNSQLYPGIETLFLPTSPQLRHISSSLAKDIAKHGGDAALLVPTAIAAALKQKLQKT